MAQPISNTLLPGLGGSGYANTAPINFGALNTSKPLSTPAKSIASPVMSNVSAQYPAATSGVKGIISPTSSALLPGLGGAPVGGSNPLAQGSLNLQQPTYSSSGGAIIPQSGAAGTPVQQASPPPQQYQANYSPPPAQQPVPQTVGLASAPQYSPNAGLYGNVAASLANTAQQGSPVASAAIGATQTASQGAFDQGTTQEKQAFDFAQQYNKQLQDLRSGYANEFSNIQGSGIPLEFQQGREQVLQNQYANLVSGYGAALQGESTLAGIGQTGTGQGVTGLGASAGAANTAQSQTLSGLASAGSLAAPILGQYGQANYGVGGQGDSGVSPSDPFYQTLQSYAQQAANGQYSSIPSSITSNSVLNNQMNQMAKAINPSYNPVVSNAQSAVTASNVQVGGTAPTQASNAIYQQARSDYADLTQSVQNVDQFGTTLTSGMVDKTTGEHINPTDVKWANKTLADVRSALSNQQQAQFDTTFAALKSKVSGLLSVGGNEIPTQITSDANKILSGSAPLGTLNATLQRIQTEGNILLQTQAQKVNDALSSMQGGNTSPSSSGGNTYTSNSGNTYKLPY